MLLTYVDSIGGSGGRGAGPEGEEFKGMYSFWFSWHPVINLRYLNKFIKDERFNLKDAYFHVPVAEEFRKYLQFTVVQEHLQFTYLPFGHSTSLQVFSKVLLAVVALIRTRGICLHHYLNDLLLSQDKEQLLLHRAQVISILLQFGWLLNSENNHPEPALVNLGAQFDTVENTISLSM